MGACVRERGGGKFEKIPNDLKMPVAWIKTCTGTKGKTSRVFTTTMGAAVDLESEGLRRLLGNGRQYPATRHCGPGRRIQPGLKPSDYALKWRGSL